MMVGKPVRWMLLRDLGFMGLGGRVSQLFERIVYL